MDILLLIIVSIISIISTVLFLIELKDWIQDIIDKIEERRRINKYKNMSKEEEMLRRYYRDN